VRYEDEDEESISLKKLRAILVKWVSKVSQQ
jgi:hypothetical protein